MPSQARSDVPLRRMAGISFLFLAVLTRDAISFRSWERKDARSACKASVFLTRALWTDSNTPLPAVKRQSALHPSLAYWQTFITPDSLAGARYRIPVRYPSFSPLIVLAFSTVNNPMFPLFSHVRRAVKPVITDTGLLSSLDRFCIIGQRAKHGTKRMSTVGRFIRVRREHV